MNRFLRTGNLGHFVAQRVVVRVDAIVTTL